MTTTSIPGKLSKLWDAFGRKTLKFKVGMKNQSPVKSTRVFNQVQVKTDKGVLRLQFPSKLVKEINSQGIKFPRFKSLGKREFDPKTGFSNLSWALAIANRIQADLDHPDGLFDITLEKYLSTKVPQNADLQKKSFSSLTVGSLWEEFMIYLLAGKTRATQKRYNTSCRQKLESFWEMTIDNDTANEIRYAFLAKSDGNAKLTMQLLKRAADWAIKQKKLPAAENPFDGIADEIKGSRRRLNKVTGLPNKYVAFSEDEAKTILNAFWESEPRKYYNFFKLKFLTGCRTGEAAALTWNDIKFNERVILFNKTWSDSTGLSKGTKTEHHRLFPMNNHLIDWLLSVEKDSTSEVLFPGVTRKYVSCSQLYCAWGGKKKYKSTSRDGVVFALAKEGKLQYLPPYNTRHTFINCCIDRGIDTTTIADWCGNSDNVIEQVYRSRNRNVNIERLPQF